MIFWCGIGIYTFVDLNQIIFTTMTTIRTMVQLLFFYRDTKGWNMKYSKSTKNIRWYLKRKAIKSTLNDRTGQVSPTHTNFYQGMNVKVVSILKSICMVT